MTALDLHPCPHCMKPMREVFNGERKSKVSICWHCDYCNKSQPLPIITKRRKIKDPESDGEQNEE